jgi:hypothetical protein
MVFVTWHQYKPATVAVNVGFIDPSCQRNVLPLPADDELSKTLVPPQTSVSDPRLRLIPLVLTCLLNVSVPQLVTFINSTL